MERARRTCDHLADAAQHPDARPPLVGTRDTTPGRFRPPLGPQRPRPLGSDFVGWQGSVPSTGPVSYFPGARRSAFRQAAGGRVGQDQVQLLRAQRPLGHPSSGRLVRTGPAGQPLISDRPDAALQELSDGRVHPGRTGFADFRRCQSSPGLPRLDRGAVGGQHSSPSADHLRWPGSSPPPSAAAAAVLKANWWCSA
jgi:hypothetical protein